MTIPKDVMLDTVGTASQHIPTVTPYIGGYVSGSGSVPWSQADWDRFPNSRHNRILQHANTGLDPHSWDSVDMETNALTAAEVAAEHKRHVDAGIEWTNVYATRTNFALAVSAIKGLGSHYWDGHVTLWLADWNLDEEQAVALIGTFIEGATCIGVQWASPTSNPNTLVPGGTATLVQANIDISVVDGTWVPSVSFDLAPPPVVHPATEHAILVTDDGHGNLTEKSVSSTDDTHWA